MGAPSGILDSDGPQRIPREISGRSSLRTTYRVDLPDPASGTELDRKPSEISTLDSAGLKPRGHHGDKTSDEVEERKRRYQSTLAKGLADAVERGDFELADTYEAALGRLLK